MSVTNTGTHTAGPDYGPFAGWTARAISARPATDAYTRVLWTNGDSAQLWLMNANNTKNLEYTFTGTAGWSPIDISAAVDNTTRMLWVNAVGQAQVWSITDAGVVTKGAILGGTAGWTATRLSSGSDGYTRLLWFNNDGAQSIWELNPNGTQFNATTFGPY
jgi:hypothetical protein